MLIYSRSFHVYGIDNNLLIVLGFLRKDFFQENGIGTKIKNIIVCVIKIYQEEAYRPYSSPEQQFATVTFDLIVTWYNFFGYYTILSLSNSLNDLNPQIISTFPNKIYWYNFVPWFVSICPLVWRVFKQKKLSILYS